MFKLKNILLIMNNFLSALSQVTVKVVDETNFNLMVLITKEDILKTCTEYKKYKSGLIKEKPSSY
jgi:hypothetical protein